MEKDVILLNEDREVFVYLSGEIDHHTAKTFRAKIDTALFSSKPELLTLDFSRVKFMDSSGIGLIIGRSEICETIGCRMEISGLSGTMKKVVMLSGIRKLKNITVV